MIILEKVTPVVEEFFDFVIALESERDNENVHRALENGRCMIVDDSCVTRVLVESCNLSMQIVLGVVLKRTIACGSLEDDQMGGGDMPVYGNLLTDFTIDCLHPCRGGKKIKISENDRQSFRGSFSDALADLECEGLVVRRWGKLIPGLHSRYPLYGLSNDLFLKIARGDVKIS